jgi:hypothetical protein
MDSMEYRLSKFKNDIANQFWHNVFYNNVLILVFYYLLEKRINTRILFLMTTYRRVLAAIVSTLNCIRYIHQSLYCSVISVFDNQQLEKLESKLC